MKAYRITPADVLLFRGERPFGIGLSRLAEAGPLSIQTFEGALKTLLLRKALGMMGRTLADLHDPSFRERLMKGENIPSQVEEILTLIGYPPRKPKPLITLILLQKEGEIFIPTPAHFVYEIKEMDTLIVRKREPCQIRITTPSFTETLLLAERDPLPPLAKRASYIRLTEPVKHLLSGESGSATILTEDLLTLSRERRTGHEQDRQRRTVQYDEESGGRLFTAEYYALQPGVSFLILLSEDVPHDLIETEETLTLGGEQRIALLTPAVLPEELPIKLAGDGEKFTLTLTASIPLPPGNTLHESIQQVLPEHARLEAFLLSQRQFIGGFDIARGHEKPLRPALPQGTTLFVTLTTPEQPVLTSQDGLQKTIPIIGRWSPCT